MVHNPYTVTYTPKKTVQQSIWTPGNDGRKTSLTWARQGDPRRHALPRWAATAEEVFFIRCLMDGFERFLWNFHVFWVRKLETNENTSQDTSLFVPKWGYHPENFVQTTLEVIQLISQGQYWDLVPTDLVDLHCNSHREIWLFVPMRVGYCPTMVQQQLISGFENGKNAIYSTNKPIVGFLQFPKFSASPKLCQVSTRKMDQLPLTYELSKKNKAIRKKLTLFSFYSMSWLSDGCLKSHSFPNLWNCVPTAYHHVPHCQQLPHF